MAPRLKAAEVNKTTSMMPSRKQPARKVKKEVKVSIKAPPGNGRKGPLWADSVQQALYQARFSPAWPHYEERLHLMGLPGEIRDLIFSFVLPIDVKANADGSGDIIDQANHLRIWPKKTVFFLPILHICRQLRYEYGALLLKRNTFHWDLPHPWNPAGLTYFTQFAASVGCQNYQLAIHVYCDMDHHVNSEPGIWNYSRHYLGFTECWNHLKQWARDVYDGVETRVLVAEGDNSERVRVLYHWYDDEPNIPFIVRVLDEARLARGTTWSRFDKKLQKLWGTYWEDGPYQSVKW
ncbi:hypothetical protein N0V93_004050 [Gnomoniopsis smithogilvyi]|uniref:Uncharacterized protein n=1 Tax=Gnomoniopsis smithogilvyi TaxID=1191159 RepID=A0A9W8YXT3_9PEZI|nr:hypothetical protein N0V93_004050 [Gnomoniopsis smithogilvyi]